MKSDDEIIEDAPTGIQISVKNPNVIKEGIMSKNYIVYDVEGEDSEGPFKVKRRFKDFYELRSKLVEHWPGVLIPPLPEKKITVDLAHSGKHKQRFCA